MNIRNAGEQDVDDIARLEAACFSDPWPADLIARMVDRFVVATDDGGALFGYLVLSTVLDEGSIDNVAVSPSMRRCGTAVDAEIVEIKEHISSKTQLGDRIIKLMKSL